MSRGLLVVLSSPSGGGKGTILKELFSSSDENYRFSVSATTRPPRPGEVDGKDYYFVSRETFEKMLKEGKLLEYTEYVGNYYGTPVGPIEQWNEQGYDVFLEIDVRGGAQIKTLMPSCVSIFILPPSMEVLSSRLHGRGTEKDTSLDERLEQAEEEISHAKEYDYIVVNDRLEDAVDDIRAIIRAEKRKYVRNTEVVERVLEDAKTV